jgi:hypothetical protein
MANIAKPQGFVPIRYKNGSPWNGMATPYYIPSSDSNAYNIGDAVKSVSGGDSNGICQITLDSAGTATERGVIVGVLPVPPLNNSQQAVTLSLEVENVPATKTRAYYVLVADDPNIIYALQDDGLTALTTTACNKNASFTYAAANANSPNSQSVLLSSSLATTQSLNLKVMGLVQAQNNAIGANAIWQVIFNQHELGGPNTIGA